MPSSASISLLGGAFSGRTSNRTRALLTLVACPTVVLLRLVLTTAAAPSSAAPAPDDPAAQSWWTADAGGIQLRDGSDGRLGPIYDLHEKPASSVSSSSASDGINTIGGGSGGDKDASIDPPSDGSANANAPVGSGGSGGLMGWFSSNNNNNAPSSSWSFLPFSSGDARAEEPRDGAAVIRGDGGMCMELEYDHKHQQVWPMWVEMDDDRGDCCELEEMVEEEDVLEENEEGGGDIIQDVAEAAAAADDDDDTPADIIENGGSIDIVSVYAHDAVQDDAVSVAASTTSYSPIIDGTSSGSYDSAPVEFNQHLLVEVGVAIADPWEQTVDYRDISPPPSAHVIGVMNDVGVGGSSGRGAAWSGDHGGSGSGTNGGSGWAVTLEEVVFTHRESRLEQMERRLWPMGGSSGSAASASTSFLIPLDSLHHHIVVGATDDDDPIDRIRELVLRASLVELIPSVKDDAIDRRVAMVRLVPVPLTEDGLINPVISVHLNGTASANPGRIGDDPTNPSATSSWGSMLITAVAAVAVGVVMALCFLHMHPAYGDEYEHYQQQVMEEDPIHYMHAHSPAHAHVHPIDNEAGTEAMGEMASMEVDEGVGGNMLIGDDADSVSSQVGEAEEEEEEEEDNDMASPPDVKRKMTSNDMVGALSTPVKTPVKEQPVTSGLGAMPSAGNPLEYDDAVDEGMPLPDDGSAQQPQMDQSLMESCMNEDHNAALPKTDDIGGKSPGSGGQLSASIDEQKRSSFSSFGLTLGQRSFCSDSSAASASSIETHLHANWKQSQTHSQKETAPTADTAPRGNTSIVASSPTRSTSSSIAAEAGNMTTVGDATTERQGRQPRRRPRQLPSQNAPLFVEKRSPKHRKVEVKPLPTIGASRRLKKEEKKWDDSRYKFGATASAGGSLSSKDRSASTNKAPSVAKSDSSKSSSKRKRKTAMPLASISVPSDVNAKKQRKSA